MLRRRAPVGSVLGGAAAAVAQAIALASNATPPLLAAMLCVAFLAGPARPQTVGPTIPASGARSGSLVSASIGSMIVLLWFASAGQSHGVMMSMSRDGGATYSRPTQIGVAHPSLRLDRAAVATQRPAGGEAVGGARVVAAWPTMREGQSGIWLAELDDGGRSVTRFVQPPGDLPPRAVVSALAFGPDGQLHVLWIADGARLYYAYADGRALAAASLLDASVSRCASTALGVAPDGAVAVFWHRSFGTDDDEFAYARSETGGRTFGAPLRLSREPWRFGSCPGASPSLAIDATGAVRFVFQIALPGSPARSVFMSDTSSDGRRFKPRTHLDVSGFDDARRPQLVPDGEGGLSLVWDGIRNGRRYVMIRHSPGPPGGGGGTDADWMRTAPPIALDHSGRGNSPVVVPRGRAILAAWITGGAQGEVVGTRMLSIDELCGRVPGARSTP